MLLIIVHYLVVYELLSMPLCQKGIFVYSCCFFT
jgi:hypothetical protein